MWMHYGYSPFGHVGRICSFFFILSGFLVTVKGPLLFNYKKYIIKKFIHIYPLAWLAIFFSVFIRHNSPNVNIIPHLLLLQSWIPTDNGLYFTFNVPAWFLSSMLFCSLLSPFISNWIKNKTDNKLLLYGVITLLILTLSIFLFSNISNRGYRVYFMYVNPVIRLMEYFMGMCLGLVYYRKNIINLKQDPVKSGYKFSALFTIMELLLISVLLYYSTIGSYSYYILLPLIALFAVQKGFISKILSLKPFQFLSVFSFEIYMIHHSFIGPFWAGNNISLYRNVIVYSIFVIIISYLSRRYLLQRVENSLSKRLLQ